MRRVETQLHPTTMVVLAAHEAHLPKDVTWRRRGFLQRLSRAKP
jgi:hypothetical protein